MVMHVMSAVCLLLQLPTDWSNVKHLMADPMTFLRRLTSFDKDNVPDKVWIRGPTINVPYVDLLLPMELCGNT